MRNIKISTLLFLILSTFSISVNAKDPEDKALCDSLSGCFDCNTPKLIYDRSCTQKCPNRIEGEYGGGCILKECPSNAPLRSIFGDCYTCDTNEDVSVEGDWDCAQCPNMVFFDKNDGEGIGTCTKACPDDKPIKIKEKKGFSCHSCDDIEVLETNTYGYSNCLQCPNRELDDENRCILKKCTDSYPIRDGSGSCRSPNDPKPIRYKWSSNFNNHSDYQKYVQEQCALYPQRELKDIKYSTSDVCILKVCPENYPIRGKDGGCYACDNSEAISTDEKNCSLCPSRVMFKNQFEDQCVLGCSKEAPLLGTKRYENDIDCYPCDEKDPIKTNMCSACPNRIKIGEYCGLKCPADKPLQDDSGRCYSCDEEYKVRAEADACAVCPNREQVYEFCHLKCTKDKPLQSKDRRCYACQGSNVHVESKEKCDVCPNSVYLYLKERDEHLCISCPADKPLISEETGECYACTDDRAIKLIESQKDNKLCGDTRKTVNGYSALKKCPAGLLVDNHGECWNCDNGHSLIDVSGSEENCSVCPNRIVKDGYCIIDDKDKPIIKIEKRYKSISRYSCDEKGDYGIGLREIEVTGTEDTCLLCPNRRIRKTKEAGEIRSYCVGKE